MKADTIRLASSSLIALIIVAYGMFQLGRFAEMGIISGEALLGIYSGLIGLAGAWALNRESSASAARSFEKGVTTGATAVTAPTMTVTGGSPVTATLTPTPPPDDPAPLPETRP